MKTLSVVIEEETYKKLKEVANTDMRSLSNWVLVTIKKELKSREVALTQFVPFNNEFQKGKL